jgi:hypothetical protein
VSGEFWFLFLMFGLKLPLFGLAYFLYRVLRAHDEAWENQDWSEDQPPDDGGGGGGSLSPAPVRPPRGGPARRRAPRERPLRHAYGRPFGGRRPARRRPPAPG